GAEFSFFGAGESYEDRVAYLNSCASVRASNASGAFVLPSRVTNEPSVKHCVFSDVLLRPHRYFDEVSLDAMPLKLMISGDSEKCVSVSSELLAEQEGVFARNKLFQLNPSLRQWLFAEIVVVQM